MQRNRLGKTRDLFKKIGNTKGIFHAKTVTKKNRNIIDLKEEEILRRRVRIHRRIIQKKKDLNDPDNHDYVVAHLEPDILECIVKWASGNTTTNKAGRGDEVPAELF